LYQIRDWLVATFACIVGEIGGSRFEGSRRMLKTWTGQTELKDDDTGTFAARIATLGVVDKDSDVTVKGAFDNANTVRVSRFNHSSAIRDDLPVGVAKIREDGDAVIAEGKLNLQSAGGRELYDTLKFEQQHNVQSEWSYGFTVLESESEQRGDQKVRVLTKLNPFEVSPVMRAAGEDTATLSVKDDKTATDFANLPMYDRDYRWDSGAALKRVRKWASSDGSGDKDAMDWEKYKKAFFWYDPEDDSSFGGFKLPFADITDDKLYAVPRGIFAVAGVLQGARGGVAISIEDQDHIKDTVDRYYEKMRKEFDDDSIMVPWSKQATGLSLKHEGDLALTAIDSLHTRINQLVDLRVKEGRTLSSANRTRLSSLRQSMVGVVDDLNDLLAATETPQNQMMGVLADVAAFQAALAQYGQE
jgi:hypothetical protein